MSDEALRDLITAAWPNRATGSFRQVLDHSCAWICAYDSELLVGYVNLAWDGGKHLFLLDTTVHPEYQRRGIGTVLVRNAIEVGKSSGAEWLHVDYEPHLDGFYAGAGFQPTKAGLVRLHK